MRNRHAMSWDANTWLWSLLAIVVMLAAWWLVTGVLGLVPNYRFPDPAAAFDSLKQISLQGYAGGTLWQHMAASSLLVVQGFIIAVVLGMALGLLMSMVPFWRYFLLPTFNFVRPIPPLAWIPLALLWFGLGSGSKLFVMCFAAFIPVTINTMTGYRQIDPVLLAAGRVHGAHGFSWLRHVILPGVMPHALIGVRLAMQTCWTVIVAAELLGAFYGVGKVMSQAKDDVYPGMVLVGMAAVALLGIASSLLLRLVERRLTPWIR